MTPTERWLAELRDHLSRFPWRRRRILAELEDHLRLSTDELRDTGLTAAEAEAVALRRLGEPRLLAAEFAAGIAREREIRLTRTLTATAFALVGSIGLVPLLARLLPTSGPISTTVLLAPAEWYPVLRWPLLASVCVVPLVALAAVSSTAGRWFRIAATAAALGFVVMVAGAVMTRWLPDWISLTAWAALAVLTFAGLVRPRDGIRTLSPRLANIGVTAIGVGAVLRLLTVGIPVPYNASGLLMAFPNLAVLLLSPICIIALVSYGDARSVTEQLGARDRLTV